MFEHDFWPHVLDCVLRTDLVALVVRCFNLRLSRWLWLATGGFALSLAAVVWSNFVYLAIVNQIMDPPVPGQFSWFFSISSFARIASLPILALGMAMAFRDMKEQFESYRIQILRFSGDKSL